MTIEEICTSLMNASSQKEVLELVFELQLQTNKLIENKGKVEYDEIDIINHLFDLLKKTNDMPENLAYPILNAFPSVVYTFEMNSQNTGRKKYLKDLIKTEIRIERRIPLFHSIAELQLSYCEHKEKKTKAQSGTIEKESMSALSNETSGEFLTQIKNLSQLYPDSASAFLNIVLFICESKTYKTNSVYQLICEIFDSASHEEQMNCAFLLRQSRSKSVKIAKNLCSIIKAKHYRPSLYILLLISSFDILAVINTMNYLLKIGEFQKCSIRDYNCIAISSNDIIEVFCGLCQSKNSNHFIPELANFLAEIFLTNPNPDIITFALVNEDESNIFLKVTIEAFDIISRLNPHLLFAKVDIFGILISVSTHVNRAIMSPALLTASKEPSTSDQLVNYVKKLSNKIQDVRVVKTICDLIEATLDTLQLSLLEILKSVISNPLARIIAFNELARMYHKIKDENSQNLIKEMALQYEDCLNEENYNNNIFRDENKLMVIRDIPSGIVRLLIALGKTPDNYKPFKRLIKEAADGIDTHRYLVQQLALRCDVLGCLAPISSPLINDAFMLYCEFNVAIEQMGNLTQKDELTQYIRLNLDYAYAEKVICNKKLTDPLYIYAVTKTLADGTMSPAAQKNVLDIFLTKLKRPKERVTPLCQLFYDINPDIFGDAFSLFRESIAVLVAKHVDHQLIKNKITPEILFDMMRQEITEKFTWEQSTAYALLYRVVLKEDLSKSMDLLMLMSNLDISDPVIMSDYTDIVLTKTPIEDAIPIVTMIIETCTGQIETVHMSTEKIKRACLITVCKWVKRTTSKIRRNKQIIPSNLIDVARELMKITGEEAAGSTLLRALLLVISGIFLKSRYLKEEDRTKFTGEAVEWINANRGKLPANEVGRTLSLIQIAESEANGLVRKRRMEKFHGQKWRSGNKFVDKYLRDNSESDDDNYADVASFVIPDEDLEAELKKENGFEEEEEEEDLYSE